MEMYKAKCGHFVHRDEHDRCPYCGIGLDSLSESERCYSLPTVAWKNSYGVVLRLGNAPDGLPRFINIKHNPWRSNVFEDCIEYRGDGFSFDYSDVLPEKIYDDFISSRPLDELFPSTLFSSILGKQFHHGYHFMELERTLNYGENNNNRSRKRLGISIAGTPFAANDDELESEHNIIIDESLSLLSPKFQILADGLFHKEELSVHGEATRVYFNKGSVLDEGSVYVSAEYTKALLCINDRSSEFKVRMAVQRGRFANLFIEVAKQLSCKHAQGLVHCDLKPQNILITKDGIVSIDSLEITIGQVSHAFTPSYCAPEQVLGKPVSPATDVYSLGLMLLQLLDARLYGAVRDHVAILSGRSVRMTMFESVEIYIEKEKCGLGDEGVMAWQKFISQCLAFDISLRLNDMNQFAGQFADLIEKYPVSGAMEFDPNRFGELTLFCDQAGSEHFGWMLRDHRVEDNWQPG